MTASRTPKHIVIKPTLPPGRVFYGGPMASNNQRKLEAIYARIPKGDRGQVDRCRRKAGYSWNYLIGNLLKDWLAVLQGKEPPFITRTKAERTAHE